MNFPFSLLRSGQESENLPTSPTAVQPSDPRGNGARLTQGRA